MRCWPCWLYWYSSVVVKPFDVQRSHLVSYICETRFFCANNECLSACEVVNKVCNQGEGYLVF